MSFGKHILDCYTLTTCVMERMLCIHKSLYYQQKKVVEVEQLKRQLCNAKNNKERRAIEKAISDNEKECTKNITRCEKYNNEVCNDFISINNGSRVVDSFVEQTKNIYNDLTMKLLEVLKDASPSNPKSISAAILVADENGDVTENGVKYKMHVIKED